jgi:hypothetical protein
LAYYEGVEGKPRDQPGVVFRYLFPLSLCPAWWRPFSIVVHGIPFAESPESVPGAAPYSALLPSQGVSVQRLIIILKRTIFDLFSINPPLVSN